MEKARAQDYVLMMKARTTSMCKNVPSMIQVSTVEGHGDVPSMIQIHLNKKEPEGLEN